MSNSKNYDITPNVELEKIEEEEDETKAYTCDEAINSLGVGKFQLILCILCGCCWSADAMEMMLLSFLLPAAGKEWELKSYQTAMIGSIVFVGMLFGSSFWGIISDRYGRRVSFMLTSALTGIFGLASAFSPSYGWLLLFRALVGFGLGGAHVAFSLFAEYLPEKNRGKPLILFEAFWTIGTVAEAGVAWLLLPTYGWRLLLGVSAIPTILLLLCYRWLPESPRYLIVRGRREEAVIQLKKAAQMNKTELPPGRLISTTILSKSTSQSVAEKEREKTSLLLRFKSQAENFFYQLIQLLKRPLLFVTLMMWLIWFTNNLVYYGLVLFAPALYQKERNEDGNNTNDSTIYMEILITSMAELPGLLLATFGIDRLGRKKTLSAMFFGCGTSIALLATPIGERGTVAFSILARMCIMGSFSSVYVYTQEVYPTSVRSTGLGVCSSVSRVAGILTPFVSDVLSKEAIYIPVVIYSLITVFSGVACMALPIETHGRGLEDVVSDITQPPKSAKDGIIEVSPLLRTPRTKREIEIEV